MSIEHFQSRSVRVGREYEERCVAWVEAQGWTVLARKVRHPGGIEVDILAVDLTGERVAIECKGGDRERPGLQRSDNIWKVLGQALVLYNWNRAHRDQQMRFLCITSAQPPDNEPLAEPLRVAEANDQVTILVVP